MKIYEKHVGWLWLAGWLAGRRAGWLAGWLAGWGPYMTNI